MIAIFLTFYWICFRPLHHYDVIVAIRLNGSIVESFHLLQLICQDDSEADKFNVDHCILAQNRGVFSLLLKTKVHIILLFVSSLVSGTHTSTFKRLRL